MIHTTPETAEVIGTSSEGRPLFHLRAGGESAAMRVLIMAGQHGDEHGCRTLVQQFMRLSSSELDAFAPGLQFAILPDVNPDGFVRNTRHNADGLDLNRDHQRLRSREIAAVHAFAHRYRPHVIIDLHNFRARRRHLLARDLVFDHEVFLDGPTHPAIHQSLADRGFEEVIGEVRGALARREVRCDRYVIITPSYRVRHSTLDVCDARNALALTTGALVVLFEAREARRREERSAIDRLMDGQFAALRELLHALSQRATLFSKHSSGGAKLVPLRFHYTATGSSSLAIEFAHRRTGQTVIAQFPTYVRTLKITRSIDPPRAYALPADRVEALETLRHHGFHAEPAFTGVPYAVEAFEQSSPGLHAERSALHRSRFRTTRKSQVLDGWSVVRATTENQAALAVFLDPNSKYGLDRFPELRLGWDQGNYPVVRILAAGNQDSASVAAQLA